MKQMCDIIIFTLSGKTHNGHLFDLVLKEAIVVSLKTGKGAAGPGTQGGATTISAL